MMKCWSSEENEGRSLLVAEMDGQVERFLYEMCFNSKLSGYEVYYIFFSVLLVKIMLCG